MNENDFPKVNFRFSQSALLEIGRMREEWNRTLPEAAAALCVGWSETFLKDGHKGEGVFISFYTERQMPEMSFAIQRVQGEEVVFFVLPDGERRFAGKILDFEPGTGFVLHEQMQAT